MHLMFGAPGRYIQGPGVISQIGACIAQCGRSAVVVSDSFVIDLVRAPVAQSCKEANVEVTFLPFDGEVTEGGIEKLKASFANGQADVVIGAGGGKGIDAGKALAHARGSALITLPTVASNDAPTSKNYVVYDDHHQLVHVGHLPASPRYVLVDTAFIAKAPRQFLAMGIADALTKNFEAEQCLKAGGVNMFGARPSLAGVALARECYRIIRADSEAALSGCRVRPIQCRLRARGGGGASHERPRLRKRRPLDSARHDARSLPRGWAARSGAWLAGCLWPARPARAGAPRRGFLTDFLAFYDMVGLPKSLADLGAPNSSDETLRQIAEPTLAAAHARNFERQLSIDDMIAAMKALEARTGKKA